MRVSMATFMSFLSAFCNIYKVPMRNNKSTKASTEVDFWFIDVLTMTAAGLFDPDSQASAGVLRSPAGYLGAAEPNVCCRH